MLLNSTHNPVHHDLLLPRDPAQHERQLLQVSLCLLPIRIQVVHRAKILGRRVPITLVSNPILQPIASPQASRSTYEATGALLLPMSDPLSPRHLEPFLSTKIRNSSSSEDSLRTSNSPSDDYQISVRASCLPYSLPMTFLQVSLVHPRPRLRYRSRVLPTLEVKSSPMVFPNRAHQSAFFLPTFLYFLIVRVEILLQVLQIMRLLDLQN
jgi:hypothetical protein